MQLTDSRIRAEKPGAKPRKLTDGRGMYLLINPNGSKLWRLKYRLGNAEKTMSFGVYPDVGLKAARDALDSARKLVAQGIDPVQARRDDRIAKMSAAEHSFAAIARNWWSDWKTERSDSHTGYVMRRLEMDVFPVIGSRPIAEIAAPELVRMVKKIEARGALDIAKRSLQTTSQIFRYAIAHGYASRNPAADIRPSDVLRTRKKRNYARVDGRELPELLRAIDAYQGTPTTRLAMKLMALTFVRTTELIEARWDEFDLDARRWDIPAVRMKMKTPHIVPLSTQAVEVLRTLKKVTGSGELLFPGQRNHDKPMSNNTILAALGRMGYKGKMTGHGFRGVASTLLHELGYEHTHIELQLAHQERDEVSASYNHATHLSARTKMMQAWADHLDFLRAGNVVMLRAA